MTGLTMMLANTLLIGQAGQPRPAGPIAEGHDDIVVLAHRLQKVRWEFEAANGILSKCDIKRSSGSEIVESLVCKAFAQCAAERPNMRDGALVPCVRDRVRELYVNR